MSEACFLEGGLVLPRQSASHRQGLQLLSEKRREGNRVQGHLPVGADLKKN